MKNLNEKQILGIIWKCNLCGFCPKDFECPGFDLETRWESSMARGRISIVHAIMQNNELGFQYSPLAKERLFSCTGCGHCFYACPSGIDIPSIITLGKKKLVDANNYPETHKLILDNIKQYGNPFGETSPRDSAWPELKSNTEANTVYFPGCMAIYRLPEVALDTIALFNKFGENIRVLQNETCCSGVLYRTGHSTQLEEVTKSMINDINNNPPERIIFTCPGCLETFKEIYGSELKEKFKGIELIHFSEYLIDKLTDLKNNSDEIAARLENILEKPIIWHDPCHLARGLGIYEEPRRILDTLNIPYIEFEYNRENANCCGSGSGVRSAYPEFSEEVTAQRLEEIKQLGAKTILTACPFCEYQYKAVIEKNGVALEVLDLNSLLTKLLF
ncbi:MAG: putative Fe-S oxidoreductase [Promethearchaeota archaeon]|nr:MAG: putative Fe-S oxidoreductase [Candidatus Lokiarchaeota archaeon]